MYNKVILIGNLGSDPELKFTEGGTGVANLNMATSEKWKDKDGNPQERTEWHRVVVWGKQAENCQKYLKKGSKVMVEGSIHTRDWEDSDGNKRYTTEVKASNVMFMDSRNAASDSKASESPQTSSTPDTFDDDDIPF